MTLFLIRDDDANATTDPERLGSVYAPLLDAGMPVCFAVVPAVALDTVGPDGAREGFIRADAPATGFSRLARDTPLSSWLRADGARRDVLVHGLNHARVRTGSEFGALDRAEASARIADALAIMVAALDRAPRGFVAPWDALSRPALVAATTAFDIVSTGWVDRRKLPFGALLAHARERMSRREALPVGHGWVLRHRGCRLQPSTPPDAVAGIIGQLSERAVVTVIVLHHWQFWADGGPHPVIVALADALRGKRVGIVADAIRTLDAGGRT
ncbi:MAG: DUF2334 domain-containing protein [Planctomycetes bacterium]|nr:DUF2334 domain-containing protein [Planctomycetota bacterium]